MQSRILGRGLRAFSLMLALMLLYAGALYVYRMPVRAAASSSVDQQRVDEIQQELNRLWDEISQLNQDIAAGRNSESAARERKAALAEQARLLEEQITLINAQVEAKRQEIATKSQEIAQKEVEFNSNYALSVQRLQAIYRLNTSSALSVMLSVDDFSEFVVVTDSMQRISQNDTALLQRLETQRQELVAARAEMQTLLSELEAEQEALNTKLGEYSTSIAEQDGIISAAVAQIEEDQNTMAQKAAEYAQFQREMEAIWGGLPDSQGEYVGGMFLWPLPGYNGYGYITSPFGWREIWGGTSFHTGIDISGGGVTNAPIVAANSGTVVYSEYSNVGYGNYLIIDHGGGYRTLYGHCNQLNVSTGQFVVQGQTIALVGSTGNSTGAHLHFEVRINSERVDPMPYLNGQIPG